MHPALADHKRAEDALHGESRCDDGAYVFVTGRRDAELSAALKEIGARLEREGL